MTTLLEARYLTKVFGGGVFDRNRTVALEDFSISIDGDRPSITAVVGESGSGKTTLARLLLGLVTPTRGQVLYRGRDLQTMGAPDWKAFRHDVQVIFQDPYEVYNPFYRVDHVLTTPVAKFKLEWTHPGEKGRSSTPFKTEGVNFPDERRRLESRCADQHHIPLFHPGGVVYQHLGHLPDPGIFHLTPPRSLCRTYAR